MPIGILVVAVLVASLAGFVLLWVKLRQVEHKLERSSKGLAEIERVVQTECLPALTESARKATTALDRLDAERSAVESDIAKAKEGLGSLVEELTKSTHHLGEIRVELARLIERAGQNAAEDTARAGDGAWLRDLVRAHLIGLGIGSITLDGVVAKADGSHLVRARGLRGNELWTGNVVVRNGKVESAAAVAVRMFP
jgi:hypothetical protein